MKREIKFRALYEGVWIYSDDWTKNKGGQLLNAPLGRSWIARFMECCFFAESFGQHVWIKDEKGVEIYEGDVVKDRFGRIMKVEWWLYSYCFVAISETNFHHAEFLSWVKDDFSNPKFPYTSVARVEVIGNIYEHPHLLQTSSM